MRLIIIQLLPQHWTNRAWRRNFT